MIEPYYQDDACKIYHGDCLEVMQSIPDGSIDAIITDPPYGITACDWDSVIPFDAMWTQLKRVIKPNGAIVLFGSEPFSSALRMSNIEMYKYDWKYKKGIASNFVSAKFQPMKHIEDIIVFSGNGERVNYYPIMQPRTQSGKSRIEAGYKYNSKTKAAFLGDISRNYTESRYNSFLKFPEDIQEFNNRSKGSRGSHPTQKPVALMSYLIKTYTNEGETILDFTMGSGTTLRAAKDLGRKAIGIEIEEKYCEIAVERLRQEVLL